MTLSQGPLNRQEKCICLFGGTFDPIHLGHTHIAASAVEALGLDQVIFLPCTQSPHKSGQKHATGNHRLNMCRLAVADLDWACVDDYDLSASGPSYSWRTAEAMQKKYPDARLFWLMGTDQWDALPRWNRPAHLASMVEFIVFSRGNDPNPKNGYTMHPIKGNHPASATSIRQKLANGITPEWLAASVSNYIFEQQLYDYSGEIHKADS